MAQGLSVKLDSFLKPFRGRGDNFQTFWSKFLVLADANGWDTGEKKMAKLPLLLDGAAYTVIYQLSADDKKDPAKVKGALETAFSPSPAEAYHLFVARRLLLDEPVDAYVADLRRLLELSKHAISGDGKDPVLIEQFLSGLPTEVGKTLRLAHAADPHTISQLVTKARTMQSSGSVERAAAAISPSVLCYHCNQVGHLQRIVLVEVVVRRETLVVAVVVTVTGAAAHDVSSATSWVIYEGTAQRRRRALLVAVAASRAPQQRRFQVRTAQVRVWHW